jgi:RNA polymerase sigma-70 factor (ECF subfamily)
MTDFEMVKGFLQTRSESSFRLLYASKMPHLFRMALRLSSYDKEEAEELVQEMWLIAVRKLPEFEWRSELKTWLISILINLARKKFRDTTLEQVEQIDLQIESNHSGDDTMDLEAAIAQLPDGYRKIVILHDVEGYKHVEIAQMLQIEEGTSKSQLFQARKKLRSFLSK